MPVVDHDSGRVAWPRVLGDLVAGDIAIAVIPVDRANNMVVAPPIIDIPVGVAVAQGLPVLVSKGYCDR